jgi:diketogulonate reductase-like aldo/keto reductase
MIQKRAALDEGFTTFDTADIYAGSGEAAVGRRLLAIGCRSETRQSWSEFLRIKVRCSECEFRRNSPTWVVRS